jgi:hypothetical protein
MTTLVAAVACFGVVAVAPTYGEATSPPHVIAEVPSTTGWKLRPLDARTLAPVPGSWSRPVRTGASVALSPSGSRAAVVGEQFRVFLVSAATGRIVRKYRESVIDDNGLYWLGDANGNDSKGEPVIVAWGFNCSSTGFCGDELTVAGSPYADDFGGGFEATALMPEGFAYAFDPTDVSVYGSECPAGQSACDTSFAIPLPRMPKEGPFQVVGDVAHDRIFEISSTGLVATINHVLARKPSIAYHRVKLNGRPFKATWAGADTIALWGKDGLRTIDTRDWTTHAIAPSVAGVVATPFGLAAWTDDPDGALTVYRPDGRTRFRVLGGKRITAAHAVGSYLYADGDARYSIDLRNGRVAGPLATRARIITPDLVAIP